MSTLRSKLKVPIAIWFCTIMQPGRLSSWSAVSSPNGSPTSGFVYFHMLLDRLLDAAGISLRNTRRTHSEGM
jgi:hypothetical protein